MENIRYRIAKPSDAKQIANVHYSVREHYDVGIFSKMDKLFLKQYYRILLDDPYEVVVCAETAEGIVGFNSYTLDAKHQLGICRRHKIRLALSSIPSILYNPSIIKDLWQRYRATGEDADIKFTITEGVRYDYWAWDSKHKDAIAAVEMDTISRNILYELGVTEIFLEVDTINKKVLKMHKIKKAEIFNTITLPDGRERVFMKYSRENRK